MIFFWLLMAFAVLLFLADWGWPDFDTDFDFFTWGDDDDE